MKEPEGKCFVLSRFLFLAAMMFTAACASNSALDQKERKWEAQEITHYRMKVHHMQSIWHLQVYEIEYADGEISHTATCMPAPAEDGKCEVKDYDPAAYTVEGLFETAHRMLESKESKWATVAYNAEFGYPESITFDDPNLIDEDSAWIVVSFEAIN